MENELLLETIDHLKKPSMQLAQIQHVCNHPGMYVCPGTLNGIYAFLTGLDIATGCLTGFREWLLPRFEDGNNLAWPGISRFKRVITHDG
ncbi:MAG: hypothetical protein ACI9R3_000307 [Verrucomicrobiales bacterium]|jgi:hypothetical protein